MSSAASQFAKAVEIVGALPPDGAVKPSDDDKLYVGPSPPPHFLRA